MTSKPRGDRALTQVERNRAYIERKRAETEGLRRALAARDQALTQIIQARDVREARQIAEWALLDAKLEYLLDAG
jgi:hypothetical protein